MEGVAEERTSSLIFFHIILVISSPSSSTTGCETMILCAFSADMSVSFVSVLICRHMARTLPWQAQTRPRNTTLTSRKASSCACQQGASRQKDCPGLYHRDGVRRRQKRGNYNTFQVDPKCPARFLYTLGGRVAPGLGDGDGQGNNAVQDKRGMSG